MYSVYNVYNKYEFILFFNCSMCSIGVLESIALNYFLSFVFNSSIKKIFFLYRILPAFDFEKH